MICAGIDVSAKELSVAILNGKKVGKVMTFANDGPAHQSLIKTLIKRNVERVCLEATGAYHIDVSVALHDADQFEFMVVNPRAASHYAKVMNSRSKTDAQDAALLAGFAQQMPFSPWQRPGDQALAVRACARRLAALTRQRTQTKNQLHALQATKVTPGFIVEDVQLSIQQLQDQIVRLRAKAVELIEADANLLEQTTLLQTIKGIAQTSAIQLLGELLVLPNDLKHKQLVAMAGLDPRHFSSGTSVSKKPRISKAGNRYLRMALYMPALSASRHDRHVQGYYRHLIEDRGLKKMQALCAIMRKLLHAIHGMLRTRQPFDNRRFYALPEGAS